MKMFILITTVIYLLLMLLEKNQLLQFRILPREVEIDGDVSFHLRNEMK